MIEKTQAIVLRYVPNGNTSRIVTWLTRDHGQVATIIKGSQRPKSAFLGQFDLFYTCELLYYTRSRGDLHIAKECSPAKVRARFRHDWRACALASYATDLALRVAPPQAPQTRIYRWLDAVLDDLHRSAPTPAVMIGHELSLLAELGLAPRLNHCMNCHRAFGDATSALHFSHQRGGLLCNNCAKTDHRPAYPVPADVVAMLRNWQRPSASPDLIRRTRCDARQIALLERMLGEFLRYHLDLPLPSRDIAWAIQQR